MPDPARRLVELLKLRATASTAGIQEIALDGAEIVVRFAGPRPFDVGALGHGLGAALRARQNQLRLEYQPGRDVVFVLQQLVDRLTSETESGEPLSPTLPRGGRG